MSLRLRIPQVSNEVDPGLETRKVFMEEWAEGLPFADPLRVYRALFDRVGAINRAPLRANVRADLLEVAVGPYTRMLDRQGGLSPQQSAAAFERYRDEADAARQVAQQMALGYKLLLAETAERRTIFGGLKLARLATQRALHFLTYVLLQSYHQYLPALPDIWPELHELFAFADEHGFTDARVGTDAARPELRDGAGLTYGRIALLSAVDPLHLGYGQVWRVFTHLGQFEDEIQLSPPSGAVPANALVLDPEHDGPPRHAAEYSNGLPAEAYVIDTRQISAAIRASADFVSDVSLPIVVKALEDPPRRADERMASSGDIRLAVGLSTVHHFSGGESEQSSAARPPPSGEEDAIDIEDVDPEDTIPLRSLYGTDTWQLKNSSQRGVCLTRTVRPLAIPLVGELVGLQAGEAGVQWAVGLVRWLAVNQHGEHSVGIELLSSNSRPVRLRYSDAVGNLQQRAALVLASSDTSKVSLIVPRGTFRSELEAEAAFGEQAVPLRLGRMVELTPGVEHVEGAAMS
ncbi:MAG: hypothetical protein AAF458_23065 [Pseudomonadota bacterium]